jgi:D-alanine-D-alanine ligase
MQQKRIEIVRSGIKRFSNLGAEVAERMRSVLAETYEDVRVTTINKAADLEEVVQRHPDVVVLGIKRFPLSDNPSVGDQEGVWVSEYLDQHGIAYTGSQRPTMELDLDKEQAKAQVRNNGLATAASFLAVPGQYPDEASLPLPLPLFVKPLDIGGGRGISDDSVVRTFEAFQKKVEAIYHENQAVSLVEEYLTGREFTVAVLDAVDGQDIYVMPVELIPEENELGDRVLGADAKDRDKEQVVAVTDEPVREQVCLLARAIFEALGARDYGRIDIRMNAHGQPQFLEANLMPGPGYFTKACTINAGIDYAGQLTRVTELALRRASA